MVIMTICLDCDKPARKPCHVCGKLKYCSSACAYKCANAHLANCFVPFKSSLFKNILGSNTISEWMSKVVDDVAKKAPVAGGVAKKKKKHAPPKSHMVLRSQSVKPK